MMKRFALLLVAVVAACSPAPQPEKPKLTVYADSALTEAFTRIGEDFEAAQGIAVEFVFGASSALEKQLGADVDVYASASPETMKLMSKVFALNKLVVAVPYGNPKHVRGLSSFYPQSNPRASFAMCVEEAPCGAAAKPHLAQGVRPEDVPAPNAVGQDVKETLAKLTKGEVDAAIVYETDVKASSGVVAVEMGASEPGEPREKGTLKFPIAVVSGTPDAKKFYDHVFSDAAKAVLTDAGFDLP